MDYINEMNNLVQTISSREVAKMMETRHDNLMNKIEKHTTILEKVSDLKIKVADLWILSSYLDAQGKERKEYQVTKKGCEFLAHKTTGEKGDLFTIRYMNKFEEMEQYIKEQQPKVPTTYKEALQHLLVQVEENERLQLENQQQTKVIEKQSEVIGEMAPKAEYFDALVDNNLLTNIRDTAKELGIKERTFTEWLIQKNLCYRDKKRKIKPYANKMKYFELKEFTTAWGHSDTQTLITPRGKETFRLLLIKDGLIKDHNKQLELGLPVNEVTKSDFYN
jgi:Rha family phage regulatory protein